MRQPTLRHLLNPLWIAASVLGCFVGCSDKSKTAYHEQSAVSGSQSGSSSLVASDSGIAKGKPNSESAASSTGELSRTVDATGAIPSETDTAPLPQVATNELEIFRDVAETSGIRFTYSNGRSANEFAILESLGGGLAAFDFDCDGRQDLMFAGGGRLDNKTVTSRPCGLFRNTSGSASDSRLSFVDVTLAAGASADRFFTHGIYPGDLDGDGFDDLAISGYGGVQLLRNMGDGTFETLDPLTYSPDEGFLWSSSLAWADLDNDGLLDLYVANYVDWSWNKHPICPGQGGVEREVCAPREFAGMSDAIFRNNGSFTLESLGKNSGLQTGGKGLGVVVGDLNDDGFVDIYVANDTTDNFLYVNDGAGRFSESAVLAGVSGDDAGVSTGSMGICLFDANADLLPDLLVTNFERELSALYRNEGQGFFTYASRQAGFAAYPAGSVGFGIVALDFDFDGDQDIAVANGHVSYQSPQAPYRQLPHLFENDANRFTRLEPSGYFAKTWTGRGIVSVDINNDGARDLAISHLEEPVALLEATHAPMSNWAIVRLVGTKSNRAAVGASLTSPGTAGSRRQFVVGGGSYLSQSDSRMHIFWNDTKSTGEINSNKKPAVPNNANRTIEVYVSWPSAESEFFQIVAGRENVLVQGAGDVR